jgi:hypothetical protein
LSQRRADNRQPGVERAVMAVLHLLDSSAQRLQVSH